MDTSADDASTTTDCLVLARAAFLRGDLHAIIRLVNDSSNIDVERIWCLAMNAHFGPIGLEDGPYGEDGMPTVAAPAPRNRGRCSETVGVLMERSRAELAGMLGLHVQTVEYRRRLPANWGS